MIGGGGYLLEGQKIWGGGYVDIIFEGEKIGGGGSQCKAGVTVQFQVGLVLTGTNGRRKRRRRSGEGWKKAPFHTIKGRSSE